METRTDISELLRRLEKLEGRFPKNARASAAEGHVHKPAAGGGGGGTTIVVQKDDATIEAAATTIDFDDTDAAGFVTSSPAGEANVNMARYALLGGRAGGQSVIGGTVDNTYLTIQGNSIDASDPVKLLSPLMMAATTNDYIQDSAGNRHLTFANDTTATTNVDTFAGRVRVNGNISINGATVDNSAIRITPPSTINPAGVTYNNIDFPLTNATLGKAMTTYSVINTTGTLLLAGFNLTNYIGLNFGPALTTSAGGASTVTNFVALNVVGTVSTSAAQNMTMTTYESRIVPNINASGGGTTTVTTANLLRLFPTIGTNTTITTLRGLYIQTPSNSGTVTDFFALDIDDITATVSGIKRAIRVRGTSAPSLHRPPLLVGGSSDTQAPIASAALEVDSTTGALVPPRMTAAQRDALTAADGMDLYNSDDKKTQARENGLWQYLSTAVGNRDPGSFTILTEQYFLQYQDLILTGAEDIAVQGTGDLIVFDLPSVSGDIATTGRGN